MSGRYRLKKRASLHVGLEGQGEHVAVSGSHPSPYRPSLDICAVGHLLIIFVCPYLDVEA